MNIVLKILSYIGLILTIVPAILYFYDFINTDLQKLLMATGMVLWFVSAPFWLNKSEGSSA